MLEELFAFPIILIDGDNEERKIKDKEKFSDLLGKEDDDVQYDIVFGEAEYPYWDFIGIEDRWIPNNKSLAKAMDGKFEACVVRFANAGQILTAWPRKKFKTEIKKFAEAYELAHPHQTDNKGPELRIINLTPEQFKNATEDGTD